MARHARTTPKEAERRGFGDVSVALKGQSELSASNNKTTNMPFYPGLRVKPREMDFSICYLGILIQLNSLARTASAVWITYRGASNEMPWTFLNKDKANLETNQGPVYAVPGSVRNQLLSLARLLQVPTQL